MSTITDKAVVKGVWPGSVAADEDFVQKKHDALTEIYGPGALTIEASSGPAAIVWKFTPASDPIASEEDADEQPKGPPEVDQVAG